MMERLVIDRQRLSSRRIQNDHDRIGSFDPSSDRIECGLWSDEEPEGMPFRMFRQAPAMVIELQW